MLTTAPRAFKGASPSARAVFDSLLGYFFITLGLALMAMTDSEDTSFVGIWFIIVGVLANLPPAIMLGIELARERRESS